MRPDVPIITRPSSSRSTNCSTSNRRANRARSKQPIGLQPEFVGVGGEGAGVVACVAHGERGAPKLGAGQQVELVAIMLAKPIAVEAMIGRRQRDRIHWPRFLPAVA